MSRAGIWVTRAPAAGGGGASLVGIKGNDQTNIAGPVNRLPVFDFFDGGEVLAIQSATADQVLTFTFAAPVHLVYVFSFDHQNHNSMADPFGGTPSASQGIPVIAGAPISFPVKTQQIKVWEQAGGVVAVWGYRYPVA